MAKLDLDFVRSQFPAFRAESLKGHANFENAGGSYMCQQVIDRFSRYFEERKTQPYGFFQASIEAGEEMDLAHTRLAQYLNVRSDEVMYGPSTSQNTYVLAQALLSRMKEGDSLIISEQEHEANAGVWHRLADHGMTVKIWPIDPDTGHLHADDLIALLDDNIVFVAMTHCSNIVADIHDVRKIADIVHDAGAILIVDGVSYCPHGLPDVGALGADVYMFSTYKTFGPHQGAMVIRDSARAIMQPQAHFFNHDKPSKYMVPAGLTMLRLPLPMGCLTILMRLTLIMAVVMMRGARVGWKRSFMKPRLKISLPCLISSPPAMISASLAAAIPKNARRLLPLLQIVSHRLRSGES